jgi:ketosteroid isomerase-like protein
MKWCNRFVYRNFVYRNFVYRNYRPETMKKRREAQAYGPTQHVPRNQCYAIRRRKWLPSGIPVDNLRCNYKLRKVCYALAVFRKMKRKREQMKKIAGVIVLLGLCAGLVFARPQAAPATASTADALKQIERDWVDAVKAGDTDKLSAILADDWVGLEYDGSKETKKSAIADVKSGKSKLESLEFGPMDVKMLGNVGVVQGSDTEKSSMNGKDTSGKWVWMDVFAKRDGKWVAVRSQSAKLK